MVLVLTHIVVCDMDDDGHQYEVRYSTSNGVQARLFEIAPNNVAITPTATPAAEPAA